MLPSFVVAFSFTFQRCVLFMEGKKFSHHLFYTLPSIVIDSFLPQEEKKRWNKALIYYFDQGNRELAQFGSVFPFARNGKYRKTTNLTPTVREAPPESRNPKPNQLCRLYWAAAPDGFWLLAPGCWWKILTNDGEIEAKALGLAVLEIDPAPVNALIMTFNFLVSRKRETEKGSEEKLSN